MNRSLNNLPGLLSIAVLANVFLIWQGFNSPSSPMGDLPYAYQPWFDAFIGGGPWWGLDRAWVYPFPAFLPMVIAGDDPIEMAKYNRDETPISIGHV